MKIDILQLEAGAKQAQGLCVIIDVFRAFSTSCYLFKQGATKIYPVLTVAQAFQLYRGKPDALLIGERGGIIVEGFHYGNSPSVIVKHDFTKKEVILTTSAGTLGLLSATHGNPIITGSFVNAGAIISYIQKMQPDQVSLVAMGNGGKTPADEDNFLAQYIKSQLEGYAFDLSSLKHCLREGSGQRFFNPEMTHSPEEDFELCLALNRFNFILRYDKENKTLTPSFL